MPAACAACIPIRRSASRFPEVWLDPRSAQPGFPLDILHYQVVGANVIERADVGRSCRDRTSLACKPFGEMLGGSLDGTVRFRRVSRAMYTWPIPPAPIRPRISVGSQLVACSQSHGFLSYLPPGTLLRPDQLACSLAELMVWSAAGTLLGDSPPGNEFVSCPATPPVARLGERRAAPPGTRLAEDSCLFEEAKRGGDKI